MSRFYVIEMGVSDAYAPDYLQVDGSTIKWIAASEKDKLGRQIRTMRQAVGLATRFTTKKAAQDKALELFGAKFNVRITAHEG